MVPQVLSRCCFEVALCAAEPGVPMNRFLMLHHCPPVGEDFPTLLTGAPFQMFRLCVTIKSSIPRVRGRASLAVVPLSLVC